MVRQIVERGDDAPAVHLALVDLLRAVIQARRVAQANGVGGGKQPEPGIGPDHPVLIEQGQLAFHFQHALDHEHHIRAAGIIFVEHQGGWRLQRPGQQAFAELGHLRAVAQHDGILADQIDAADVTVEVDADARPVQPGRDLFDMGGLAGAVKALHHHPAVVGKAGQDGERGVGIEHIGRVQIGHTFIGDRKGRHRHVDIHAEHFAGVHGGIRRGQGHRAGFVMLAHVWFDSILYPAADLRCVKALTTACNFPSRLRSPPLLSG